MQQNKLDTSIVAELISGIDEWYVGVCTVRYLEDGTIGVYGENNLLVGKTNTGQTLDDMADEINELIEEEQNGL